LALQICLEFDDFLEAGFSRDLGNTTLIDFFRAMVVSSRYVCAAQVAYEVARSQDRFCDLALLSLHISAILPIPRLDSESVHGNLPCTILEGQILKRGTPQIQSEYTMHFLFQSYMIYILWHFK
jgi:hypothetical protein